MNHTDPNFRKRALATSSLIFALALSACGQQDSDTAVETVEAGVEEMQNVVSEPATLASEQESPSSERLTAVLGAQSDDVKARYEARHPKETLAFFGVEPGMTVVEADPGSGWYSNILVDYLGADGALYGAAYDMEVYRLFDYYTEEQLADLAQWDKTWPATISENHDNGAPVDAFFLGSAPGSLDGSVDVMLFVRVLHNLLDFEEEGQHLTNALSDAYRILKPGGVVGVVQHAGPETHSDEWASGANGYLKKSTVIAALEGAGFTYEGESPVNLNPKDQPTEEEYVWRLPPTSEEVEDPGLATSYAAIGESNRVTLKFRKPE